MKKLEYFPNYFPNITRVILFLLLFIILYYLLLFCIIFIISTLFNISKLRYNILKPIFQTTNKPNQKIHHHQPLIYRHIINHHNHDQRHNLNKIISQYHYIIISTHLYHINITLSSWYNLINLTHQHHSNTFLLSLHFFIILLYLSYYNNITSL